MKKILYLLSLVICFAACDKDDDTQNSEASTENMYGEWLLYDGIGGQSFMEVQIDNSSSYKSIAYTTQNGQTQISDIQSGYWGFFAETKSLRISALSETTGMQKTLDFELVEADEYKLVLRDKNLNSRDTYCRIIDSYNTTAGKEIVLDLSNKKFNATTYNSINTDAATIDSYGKITAVGYGTTFIIAEDSQGNKVAIKVEVDSRARIHASEINKSIDNIYEVYGQPDAEQDQDNGSYIILYRNPSIEPTASGIQFNYNKTSREVTRVLVLYKSEEMCIDDIHYLENNFYYVDFGDYYFCDTEEFLLSTIHILPFESNGSYYIHYGSTQQLLNYGHY